MKLYNLLYLVLLLFVFIPINTTAVSEGLANNITYYYGLNETTGTLALESVNRTHNGTTCTGEWTNDYVLGGSAFNGSDDDGYIVLPSILDMKSNIQTKSLSMWVKWLDISGTQIIYSDGVRWSISLNWGCNGGIEGHWNDGTSDHYICSNVTPSVGKWYHIVLAMDFPNNRQTIYINGTLSNTTTKVDDVSYDATRPSVLLSADTTVGCGDGASYGKAVIDEVGIFLNEEINSTEASDLYNGGAGLPYPFPEQPNTPPPTVTVFNTSVDYNVNQNESLGWTAVVDGDGDTITYRVWFNDTIPYLFSSSTDTNFTTNITAEKRYGYWVETYDGEDIGGNSTTQYITLDTTIPTLTWNSPTSDPTYTTASTILANITCTDDREVWSLNISLYNATNDVISSIYHENASNTTLTNWTTFTLADNQNNTIMGRCYDSHTFGKDVLDFDYDSSNGRLEFYNKETNKDNYTLEFGYFQDGEVKRLSEANIDFYNIDYFARKIKSDWQFGMVFDLPAADFLFGFRLKDSIPNLQLIHPEIAHFILYNKYYADFDGEVCYYNQGVISNCHSGSPQVKHQDGYYYVYFNYDLKQWYGIGERLVFYTKSTGALNVVEENRTVVHDTTPPVITVSFNDTSPPFNSTVNATATANEPVFNYWFWNNISFTNTSQLSNHESIQVNYTRGSNVSFVVCANDTLNQMGCGEGSFVVGNTKPLITAILNSSLGTNFSNEDLTCYNTSQKDDDDDPLSVSYYWFNKTTLITALNNLSTISSGNITPLNNWSCNITVVDGFDAVSSKSENLIVRNLIPPTVDIIRPDTTDVFDQETLLNVTYNVTSLFDSDGYKYTTNVYLYNNDFSIANNITLNATPVLGLNYILWNHTNHTSGEYRINISSCDILDSTFCNSTITNYVFKLSTIESVASTLTETKSYFINLTESNQNFTINFTTPDSITALEFLGNLSGKFQLYDNFSKLDLRDATDENDFMSTIAHNLTHFIITATQRSDRDVMLIRKNSTVLEESWNLTWDPFVITLRTIILEGKTILLLNATSATYKHEVLRGNLSNNPIDIIESFPLPTNGNILMNSIVRVNSTSYWIAAGVKSSNWHLLEFNNSFVNYANHTIPGANTDSVPVGFESMAVVEDELWLLEFGNTKIWILNKSAPYNNIANRSINSLSDVDLGDELSYYNNSLYLLARNWHGDVDDQRVAEIGGKPYGIKWFINDKLNYRNNKYFDNSKGEDFNNTQLNTNYHCPTLNDINYCDFSTSIESSTKGVLWLSYNITYVPYKLVFNNDNVIESSFQRYDLTIANLTNATAIDSELIYNGTSYGYDSTKSFLSYTSFNYSLNIPLVSDILSNVINLSFYFDYNHSYTTGVDNRQSLLLNQTISQIILDNCSVGEAITLNVSLVNFSTLNPVNGTIEYVFNYYIPGFSDIFQNYSNSKVGFNETFCITPNWSTFQSDILFEYSSDTTLFDYSVNNLTLNNVSKAITLYVQEGTTQVLFTVQDTDSDPIEGAYIHVMRFDIPTNTYIVTEILRTDSQGQALGNIILGTTFYNFFVYFDGSLRYTEEGVKLLSTTRTFTISLEGTAWFDNFDTTLDVMTSLIFNNQTDNFVYTWTDPSSEMHYGCLRVDVYNQTGKFKLHDSCVNSASSTILYNVGSRGNGTEYIATGYLKFDDIIITDTHGIFTHSTFSLYRNAPDFSLFIGILFSLTMFLLGIPLPGLSVSLLGAGILISSWMGLWVISLVQVASIIILVIIQLYLFGRR